MHGITRGLERRLRALEQRLGAVQTPETPAEAGRRLELVRAVLAGDQLADLAPEERAIFEKLTRDAPTFQELQDEGLITQDGRPGGDDGPDVMEMEDVDEDGDDRAPVWHP